MRTGLGTTAAATAAVIARGEDGLEMAWVDCAFLVVVVAVVLVRLCSTNFKCHSFIRLRKRAN